MNLSGDKILSVLVDSLSIEEMEELLTKKKNTITPDKVTVETELKQFYRKKLEQILYAPKI